MAQQRPPEKPTGNRSLRLTFKYEGDAVTLVEQESVAMLAPPDDAALLERGQSGFHVELQDADGKPLYRRVLHAPIRDSYEVFSPEPGAAISHVPMDRPHGFFKVVVPDVAGGHSVVVVGPPSAIDRAAAVPGPIIRVKLHGEKPPRKAEQQ